MDDELAQIQAVLAGDQDAREQLLASLVPRIEAIARSHPQLRSRGLAQSADTCAEIVTSTLERLLRDDYKNLRRFVSQRPEQASAFGSWVYGAVDFAIRDYLRGKFGRAPHKGPDDTVARPSKRDVGSMAGRFEDERYDRSFVRTLGATRRLTVAAIFEYAREHFDADEFLALRMFYVEDRNLQEIALALKLPDERAADKLLRKLNARLRYRYGEQAEGEH